MNCCCNREFEDSGFQNDNTEVLLFLIVFMSTLFGNHYAEVAISDSPIQTCNSIALIVCISLVIKTGI